jgi:iron(III) transport system substrate-binding protein
LFGANQNADQVETGRMTASIRPRAFTLRTVAVFVGAALTCSFLAACGSSGGSGGSDDSITLFNGQHEQTANELVAAFEKQTGIHVNVRSDDEDVLANQIALQGQNSPADVFFTENSPPLEFLAAKHLLSALPSSTFGQIPSRYSSPQKDWIAVSGRVSVLVYNPSLIPASQLPTSVMQLADPRYMGKLALAPGETDFQPIVTSVLRAYGEARTLTWLKAIKANAAGHMLPDNETLVSDVNRGQVGFGLINQYYWYRMRSEIGASAVHSQITHFAPRDPGYVIDVSGAAVIKSSKHQANAKRFLDFLVSRKGQEIIAHSSSYEYPLLAGVKAYSAETPFSQLQPNSIGIDQLGDGATAIKLLQQVGLL